MFGSRAGSSIRPSASAFDDGLNQLLEKTASGEVKATEITRQINFQTDRLMDAAFQRILILIRVTFGAGILVFFVAKRLFKRGGKPLPPT